MQSGDNKVTCFGGCKRCAYRFIVTHFAEKYYIGGLTQAGSQRHYVALAVAVYFTLAYYALFVLVKILYRVFTL